MTRRSLVIRSSLLALILALSVWLYFAGKGHTVYFDTRAITIDGIEYRAPDTTAVSIDGGEVEEMGRAERALRTVMGPSHLFAAESLAGDGKAAKARIRIPVGMDEAILSVPALLAGLPPDKIVSPFAAPSAASSDEEEPESVMPETDDGPSEGATPSGEGG
jgi:hypothetical protein